MERVIVQCIHVEINEEKNLIYIVLAVQTEHSRMIHFKTKKKRKKIWTCLASMKSAWPAFLCLASVVVAPFVARANLRGRETSQDGVSPTLFRCIMVQMVIM